MMSLSGRFERRLEIIIQPTLFRWRRLIFGYGQTSFVSFFSSYTYITDILLQCLNLVAPLLALVLTALPLRNSSCIFIYSIVRNSLFLSTFFSSLSLNIPSNYTKLSSILSTNSCFYCFSDKVFSRSFSVSKLLISIYFQLF